MQVSDVKSKSICIHRVAVNFHQFHDVDGVLSVCKSVAASVDKATADHRKFELFLYAWPKISFSKELINQLKNLGFTVQGLSATKNGLALNLQISEAISDGVDFFYRCDADDPVYENRFLRQCQLLETTDVDICGGGAKYLNIATQESYISIPKIDPDLISFLTNSYGLHPTLGFRLGAFKQTGLKYWENRIEDKALYLSALSKGLKFQNDSEVYGTYNFQSGSRNTISIARLNLKLNLKYVLLKKAYWAIPLAYVVFALSCTTKAQTLRQIRRNLKFTQSKV